MSYGLFFSAETWALLILFVALLYLYGSWPHSFFKKLSIPGPKPLPFFGTMLEYKKGFHNFDVECFKKYGRVWGFYDARQPVLSIMDQSIIKTILVKECYSLFTNRRNFGLNGPLYDAVSIVEDDDWRRIRSVLSPSFTSGRLKEMFGIMKTHSHILVENLGKSAKRGEAADIKEFFGAYSMDVVTSTAFSVDIDSLNNPKDPFVTNIKKMLKFDFLNPMFLIIALFPFLAPVLDKMNFALFPTSVTDFFYAALQKIKSEKVANNHKKKRVDFLQLMIDSQTEGKTEHGSIDEHTEKGLSDHEILSQSMIFIFAGYETTSSTLSFFFYNMATNPEAMKKLQDEIDQTFPNKAPVDYEGIMNMDYLDAALSESLRLFPVAGRLERVCKKTVDINGLLIPKDTVVMIPTYALHRDPDYWSDPESFKPERFTKGNKESIDPYMYMPFGLGPRNCIGMRFAQVSMKLAIVEILQRFDISVCAETQVPLELSISGFLAPKVPIKLKFEPRKVSLSEDICNNNKSFTKGNKESIDPYMYMPFGLGPRNCIGMRFAQVSMKLAIVEILQRFDISVCAETQVPLELSISGFLAPKVPIKLKFEPRKVSLSEDICNNNKS
ncbi:cytochrome P450 3A30-like protein [Labeo rohita]|uniref:Cytochrome P450 3A n=2 Tax=Labeo rohita TaxID=84645 RepID=A0A498NVD6_LABRO|nr:cytochrome P450 3A30-like protein [Labeo rohita]